MTSLENAVLFVTGANGGLGRQWVAQALERGAAKVYATDLNPGTWESAQVVPMVLDVTNPESIRQAAAAAADTTMLISNAGIPLRDPILTVSQDALRHAFEVNFFGPLQLAQNFAPVLARNGGGALVNVVSAMGWCALSAGYSTAKSALWAATNALRLELSPAGIHVLGLYMAYVDTPMTAALINKPKVTAESVVRAALDGLEADEYEVLADQITRDIRNRLSEPISVQYRSLSLSASGPTK